MKQIQRILWAGGAAFFVSLGLAAIAVSAQEQFDFVILNGRLVDGSGNPWIQADVAIRGDRIAAIGRLADAPARRAIDAQGMIVAPGFIDPHTHAGRGIEAVPTADNYLLQGVTTLTEGNDGGSPFPIGEDFQRIETLKIAPNWAVYVGQGTIRRRVLGLEDRAATSDEIEQMKGMVAEAMKQGALGLSTGLFYIPGSFTPTEEVIELAKVAAAYGGIYISHMRNEAEGVLESVRETIRIGEESGIPVQMTHHKTVGRENWGLSTQTLALVDAARARGVDITMDQYPYTASQTSLQVLLQPWAQEGGEEAILKRLQDTRLRPRIRGEIVHNIVHNRGGGDPQNIVISACSWDAGLTGKNLAQITRERGLEPTLENSAEVAMDVIAKGGARAIYHAMSEPDVERIMAHPATMIGSDGGVSVLGQDKPHPREYGTFARVLGRYVRERKVLGLEEAVRKMSSAPAQRLNLHERGLLRPGYFADIVVFDPERIADRATFQDPHQYAVGIQWVWVNGEPAVAQGKITGARPGRVLRGPGYGKSLP